MKRALKKKMLSLKNILKNEKFKENNFSFFSKGYILMHFGVYFMSSKYFPSGYQPSKLNVGSENPAGLFLLHRSSSKIRFCRPE